MPMCDPCRTGMHERCLPAEYSFNGYTPCSCLHDREWMKLSTELGECLNALNKGEMADVRARLSRIATIARDL